MSEFVLYDDATARAFEPFATSRPLAEMRAGALLVRERWECVLQSTSAGFIASRALRLFGEFGVPGAVTGTVPAGSVLVNARALPLLPSEVTFDLMSGADVLVIDSRVAAVRLRQPLEADRLADGTFQLDDLISPSDRRTSIAGLWLDEVWDLVRHLSPLLVSDIPSLAGALRCRSLEDDRSPRSPAIVGTHPVWLEDGASVEPFSLFDTTLGPVLLRRGASVQAFTRFVGPCYVGRDSVVTADRVAGSSIGDVCRVHGELSASILIGHANKGHDGFVGHSVLGRWVNLGASTVTSNLKNTYGTVALWTPSGVRDTGMQFLGTLFGDHAKTGIGLRLTTGCVVGVGANVMDAMPPKMVPPFSWGARSPYAQFAFDKWVETATRVMSRRGVTFDDRQRQFWHALHAAHSTVVRAGATAGAPTDAARHDPR